MTEACILSFIRSWASAKRKGGNNRTEQTESGERKRDIEKEGVEVRTELMDQFEEYYERIRKRNEQEAELHGKESAHDNGKRKERKNIKRTTVQGRKSCVDALQDSRRWRAERGKGQQGGNKGRNK